MKTKLFIFIGILIGLIGYSQETFVPDDNFENYLETHNMGNGIPNDNKVLTANISLVTNLQAFNQNISDFTGLEDFTALTSLSCYQNQLTELDISQNTNLQFLQCANNQLTNLNFSLNTSLLLIDCSNNLITNIDVSNNTSLEWLFSNNNQLTNIDVSQNLSLKRLQVDGNQLADIDITNNNRLFTLRCTGNNITELDVSNNPLLAELDCSGNNITELNLSNNQNLVFFFALQNQLESIDLTTQVELLEVGLSNNQLTYLNIKNGANTDIWHFEAYDNSNLTCIIVDNTAYSEANWLDVDSIVVFVEDELDCNQQLSTNDTTFFSNNFEMYSNPIKKNSLQVKSNQKAYFELYDMNGKILIKAELIKGNNFIKLNDINSGVYYVKILSKYTNLFYYHKIIVEL